MNKFAPIANTLGLEEFLLEHGKNTSLIKPAIALFESFINDDKLRNENLILMDESQLNSEEIAEALGDAIRKNLRVRFIGVNNLRKDGRETQVRLYRQVNVGGLLSRLLPTEEVHRAYGNIRNSGRDTLLDLVNLSLGVHHLRSFFDGTFGTDFSRILKRNLSAIWFCYYGCILRGDAKAAETYKRLIGLLTKTAPLGLEPFDARQDKVPTFCTFVESNLS